MVLNMGYTHYWAVEQGKELPHWEVFTDMVKIMLGLNSEAGPPSAIDAESVRVDENVVRFDGIPRWETFVFERVPKQVPWRTDERIVYNFCKTNYLPYDDYVTGVLVAAKMLWKDEVKLSSDGEPMAWSAGIKEYLNEFRLERYDGDFEEIFQIIEADLNSDTEHERRNSISEFGWRGRFDSPPGDAPLPR